MNLKILLILFTFLFIPIRADSQKVSWSFELHGGAPYNIPLPLVVSQAGEPDVRLMARYRTEPFNSPFYWVWRIKRTENFNSWEFEAIHHKLYLDNNPPEINGFSISHGYNLLMINRGISRSVKSTGEFRFRLGAGLVLSHPENNIRGEKLDENKGFLQSGYYITGPVANISFGKEIQIFRFMHLNTELKCNPSFSIVPVSGGNARVWNISVAIIAGLGFDYSRDTLK